MRNEFKCDPEKRTIYEQEDPQRECIHPRKRIRLGLCAMDTKLHSKVMREIRCRIDAYDFLDFVHLDEEVMQTDPECWPRVDVLLARNSTGYEKVVKYAKLRKPIMINDVEAQRQLFDRREVYRILDRWEIPTSKHLCYNHDDPLHTVQEYPDYIVVNGVRIDKPFVEKPVRADDHNVFVYYSTSQGGGSRRLFRKVQNKSSEFYPTINNIRRNASFIYEKMVPCVKDIKVYTVGENYAHAEIRKSPTVDGIVNRDCFGKEIRREVRLGDEELEICRKIVRAFKQQVCGFDMLRGDDGKSYVIDVNGWSFVKNNRKYFDDCARILIEICEKVDRTVVQPEFYAQKSFSPCLLGNAIVGKRMNILRGTFAIFRHGDRTPKLKLKLTTKNGSLINYFLKCEALELKIHFATNKEKFKEVTSLVKHILENDDLEKKERKRLTRMHGLMVHNHIALKFQAKASGRDVNGRVSKLLCILKWGGELTAAGFSQAHHYAQVFKNRFIHVDVAEQKKFMRGLKVFTTDESRVRYTACSFVRSLLDLDKKEKIPEGVLQSGPEVQYMLDDVSRAKNLIEDSKSHIAQIINSNNVDCWVDESDDNESPCNLIEGTSMRSDESEEVGKFPMLKKPKTLLPWAQRSLKILHDPRGCCMRFYEEISELVEALKNQMELAKHQNSEQMTEDIHNRYNQESFKDMVNRWTNLLDGFYDEEKADFDATKIPNLFDSVRYELLHNANCLGLSYEKMDQLWERIEALTGFVTPQEYGVTREDKLLVSRMIAKPFFSHLAQKVKKTFSNEETTRCFLYFSSESHLHALRNALIICKTSYNQIVAKNVEGMDLSYFSHGIIRIFEDLTKSVNHPKRFYSTIHFSPGAHGNPLTQANLHRGEALIPIENPGCLNGRFPIKKLLRLLRCE